MKPWSKWVFLSHFFRGHHVRVVAHMPLLCVSLLCRVVPCVRVALLQCTSLKSLSSL